ncbi:hypothetical protein C7534_10322 [Pseudomonas sp. OV226]|jgi:hypothetical protein|nr:hypothetical protein C7534_10322 [Pseudomonas sp. OV226]
MAVIGNSNTQQAMALAFVINLTQTSDTLRHQQGGWVFHESLNAYSLWV